MALAALVFMRFGGFGTGENVNSEEFLAYAEPVENITVPESAKIIALGEATHGNAEFQQLKLEVFKLMVKNNGVRAFALEGDYGGCVFPPFSVRLSAASLQYCVPCRWR